MKRQLKGVRIEELERAYQKSLMWFFAFPRTRIGLSELARSIDSSKTATKDAIEALINQDIISREIAGRTWILQANQKNPVYQRKKIAYNLDNIYASGIVEEVSKRVPQARNMILFGSYRHGSDTEESDIDIAVEIIGNEDMSILQLGTLEMLGYRKNIPVNVHIFSRNKVDLNLFANIANGIILEGFLEVRP